MKVFIVEDSVLMRDRLCSLLSQKEGMVVVGAEGDAFRAIEGIRKTRPDVVLMDLFLENGTGIDVFNNIRCLEPCPRIFLMTAHPHGDHSGVLRGLGVGRIYNKTSELPTVIQMVENLQTGREPDGLP